VISMIINMNRNRNTYILEVKNGIAICTINDDSIYPFLVGIRMVTDLDCKILEVVCVETEPQTLHCKNKKVSISGQIDPNCVYAISEKRTLIRRKSIDFAKPFIK